MHCVIFYSVAIIAKNIKCRKARSIRRIIYQFIGQALNIFNKRLMIIFYSLLWLAIALLLVPWFKSWIIIPMLIVLTQQWWCLQQYMSC